MTTENDNEITFNEWWKKIECLRNDGGEGHARAAWEFCQKQIGQLKSTRDRLIRLCQRKGWDPTQVYRDGPPEFLEGERDGIHPSR